jgi:hypothetical protein
VKPGLAEPGFAAENMTWPRSVQLRQYLAAEQADVVQVGDIVEMQVNGVRTRGRQLGQPSGHIAGNAGDPHPQHPRPGLAERRGAAVSLAAGLPAAHRQRGGKPHAGRIAPGLLADPAEVGEAIREPIAHAAAPRPR